jgi:hypothetical protein
MKNLKQLPSVLCFLLVFASANVVLAQSGDDRNQFAAVTGLGSSVRFDVANPHAECYRRERRFSPEAFLF